ncbi:PAS domain-containing protein [Methylobacterium oryzihabitans]|nr:PAS domain-containing protein [Methylobacterium oryzihabitans]
MEIVGTWDWDILANRIYTDHVVAVLFGLEFEQATAGLPIEAYEAGIHPDDHDWVTARIREMVKSSGSFVAEYRTCLRNGDVCWVLARGHFYHDGTGRPVRSRGIIVDVTGRRLGAPGFTSELMNPTEHPLEHAVDLCLSVRDIVAEADRPFLLSITDMLLLELGRELSALIKADGKRRMI